MNGSWRTGRISRDTASSIPNRCAHRFTESESMSATISGVASGML
jgi:hypothetical protein